MPKTRFDKFYRYNELTRLLKAYAKEYPDLIQLQSIGKSYEGRDVWLVIATNFKSGSDVDKPALWVDGNLHASEVTGSTAALFLIHSLVTRYKQDENVTRALDTRAFYISRRIISRGWSGARISTAMVACCKCASKTRTAPGRHIRLNRA